MPSKMVRQNGNGPGSKPALAVPHSKPDAPSGLSVPGRGWFDSYGLHAQWAPVLAVVAPPIFATYMVFPDLVNPKGAAGGILLVGALPPMLAHTARNLGKRLEPRLWAKLGGKPTTRLLRHRDRTIPELTKRRYFLTLEHVGIDRPTEADEAADPFAADTVYESAGDWLRRHTRDPKILSLVANKNRSYGFARNSLGVRWIGFTLTLAAGLAGSWLTYQAAFEASPKLQDFAAAAAVNLLAATLWLLAVNSESVRSADDAYAIAILECLEPGLDLGVASPPGATKTPTKRKTPKVVPIEKSGANKPETGA